MKMLETVLGEAYMTSKILLSKKDMQKPLKKFVIPIQTVLYLGQRIEEALASLHKRKIEDKIYYFYVVDKEEKLQGVVSTRNLLLAAPGTLIDEVMDHSVAFLKDEQTLKQALEAFEDLRLLALPVVDEAQRLLGMIDVQLYMDESIGEMGREERRNIFQFIGMKLEEGKMGSPWRGFLLRMPWICCNLIGGLACAVISRVYQDVLVKALVLAMFIPLVLTLCESISMQSMTQSLHILRSSHLIFRAVRRRILLEIKTVFFLSFTCSVTVGLLSFLWGGGWAPVYAIGAGLFLSIIIAALVGTMVPVAIRAMQMDPKVAAGPVILMIVDVVATFVYFALASLWLLP